MKLMITVKKEKGGDLGCGWGTVVLWRCRCPGLCAVSPASRFDGRAVRTKESGTWLTASVY